MSQGFIEPLEATALDMVQETVVRFIEAANKGGFTDEFRDEFNARISRRFDAVRDYIVCHYRINTRTDTEYWRDNGTNEKISGSLRELLTAWLQGKNITDELERQNLDAYFPAFRGIACWAARASTRPRHSCNPATKSRTSMTWRRSRSTCRGCALNFKPHNEQLKAVRTSAAA